MLTCTGGPPGRPLGDPGRHHAPWRHHHHHHHRRPPFATPTTTATPTPAPQGREARGGGPPRAAAGARGARGLPGGAAEAVRRTGRSPARAQAQHPRRSVHGRVSRWVTKGPSTGHWCGRAVEPASGPAQAPRRAVYGRVGRRVTKGGWLAARGLRAADRSGGLIGLGAARGDGTARGTSQRSPEPPACRPRPSRPVGEGGGRPVGRSVRERGVVSLYHVWGVKSHSSLAACPPFRLGPAHPDPKTRAASAPPTSPAPSRRRGHAVARPAEAAWGRGAQGRRGRGGGQGRPGGSREGGPCCQGGGRGGSSRA
jgi:hypothetical protein